MLWKGPVRPPPEMWLRASGAELDNGGAGQPDARAGEGRRRGALGRRATFRDYVDLYFLLKDGVTSLKEIVEGASRKFVLEGHRLFNARLFLQQLVYFGDLEDIDTTLVLLREPVTPDLIEAFFREVVRAFVRNQADVRNPGEGATLP